MMYGDTFRTLSDKLPRLAAQALWAQGFTKWRHSDNPAVAATDLASLRRMRSTGTLTVWSGFCDNSIYGPPQRNMLARVWHDCTHLQLGKDFNYGDEVEVAREQVFQTAGLTSLERGAVWADTYGQLQYFRKYGEFPEDQLEFVRSFMSAGYRID